MLRPPIVVGPHSVGGKAVLSKLPGLSRLTRMPDRLPRTPVPLPLLAPAFPLQLIHEDDVGQALLLCTVAAGPPGAYNVAGDGVLTLADVAREFGFLPSPCRPQSPRRRPARSPGCRSCPRRPSGSRRSATPRSWTQRRPGNCWAGAPATQP